MQFRRLMGTDQLPAYTRPFNAALTNALTSYTGGDRVRQAEALFKRPDFRQAHVRPRSARFAHAAAYRRAPAASLCRPWRGRLGRGRAHLLVRAGLDGLLGLPLRLRRVDGRRDPLDARTCQAMQMYIVYSGSLQIWIESGSSPPRTSLADGILPRRSRLDECETSGSVPMVATATMRSACRSSA